MRAKFSGLCVVTLVVSLATAVPAAAGPQFVGGTPPNIGDFGPVVLNGTPQLTTASMDTFQVLDDSVSPAGWNVTLQIPDLQNGSGPDCSTGATASIPGASISMDAPVVTPADGFTSMTGVTSAGFVGFTSPQIVIDAQNGDGSGTYNVSPALLRLVVPDGALTGTYCAIATVAINVGP